MFSVCVDDIAYSILKLTASPNNSTYYECYCADPGYYEEQTDFI